MRLLYHSTSRHAADEIRKNGFLDATFESLFAGVCFADRPMDGGDGVARSAEVCIEVRIPDSFPLDAHEIVIEERPPDAYREWLVPAAEANRWQRRELDGEGAWEV